jgi:hypothetical protein
MLFLLPKFAMLNSPNSAYYARIMPHYAHYTYYAESNAGIFRLALGAGAPHRRGRAAPPRRDAGQALSTVPFQLSQPTVVGQLPVISWTKQLPVVLK